MANKEAAMPETIFLSYQRQSQAVAEALYTALTQYGFTVWQDVHNIRHTDQRSQAIDSALRSTDRLVLLMTPAAMRSREVFNEWFYFYNKRKPLHCLMVEKCEPHYQLLPFQYLPWETPEQRDYAKLCAELGAPFTVPNAAKQSIIVPSEFAPERTLRQLRDELLRTIQNADKIAVTPEQIAEIRLQEPQDETEYLLACYAKWCEARFALDEKFINLALLVQEEDRYTEKRGTRHYSDLYEALQQASSPVVVLLGLPGAGKSTLLRRLEMDIALESLRGVTTRRLLPFYISLSRYGTGLTDVQALPNPLEWLAQCWQSAAPNLPSLPDLLRQRRVVLILDGLNEIPYTSPSDYKRRLDVWRTFLQEYIFEMHGNKAIFACRSIDYSQTLSHPDYPVPQFRLQPLESLQMQDYLKRYAPEHAQQIWQVLENNAELLELFRVPYLLRLLTELFHEFGSVPRGRAHTFTRLIRKLVKRELENRTPALSHEDLLSAMARSIFLENVRLDQPHYLPDQELLIAALSGFAHTLQNLAQGQRLVSLWYQDARDQVAAPEARREQVLQAGFALTTLELDHDHNVRFFHQLLQEYFAARLLARTPNPALARSEWQAQYIKPSLEDVVSSLPHHDPLPPMPTTGWEVSMVLAAAMTQNQEQFVRDLIAPNLPLAAYCAAAPDVHVSAQLRAELRDLLIARSGDSEADLRARIAAAKALGDLGDPRFAAQRSEAAFIVPPFSHIEGGEYRIGSDENPDEQPIHTVRLAPFQIGQFPITNAEYRLFIEAGGYEDQRWWQGEAAERWRSGGETYVLDKAEWRARNAERRAMLSDGRLQAQLESGEITQAQFESRKRLAEMSEAEFEAELATWYPTARRTLPAHWHDTRFNAPTQPVVGVTWYEARAYCAWLAHHSGLPVRLPTEAEREVAVRGAAMRRYAYGEKADPKCANTVEAHIGGTTPIGIFPCGATPEGVHDLSGNIWEWTSTLRRAYPYHADDGREDAHTPDEHRVVRGGSWYHSAQQARGAYRGVPYRPYHANDNVGFRIVVG
ncbi:MAG: TIR domain-containing protein [Chloroflexi bacterium CFX4]|nr:TIR domain-containing protein [Chloroflexi bacterium CFX4]MDL1921178.1 TIR domain-containing protein [Chloroflexi bacterium CFX3]